MSFKLLKLQDEYRSLSVNVARTFYNPILGMAHYYDRAVGFFSSSSLVQIAEGLVPFIKHGGSIRILASPRLSEEDISAIKKGYEDKKTIVERSLLRELDSPESIVEEKRLNLLANLIADDRLDIRIVLLENHHEYGMYHEKMGIFTDFEGNQIAFTGSMNETATAMEINYESFDVYFSWKNEENAAKVDKKASAFESLWEGVEPCVSTYEFPDVKEEILQKYKKSNINYEELDTKEYCSGLVEESGQQGVGIPPTIELHQYQKEAISTWKEKGYCGIFDMATGTGKTFTGIGALCTLYEELQGRLAVVIVCPYQHLVEQWVEDLKCFGIQPIIGYSSSKHKNYRERLHKSIFRYNLGAQDFLCFICTNSSFATEKVQELVAQIKKQKLLIVDEAHNFGAEHQQKTLQESFEYRLALSATLERHNDDSGTQKLYSYFGDKCIEYTLERAIKEKKLTPYRYYPIPVYFTEEELEKYNEISQQIMKCMSFDKNGKSSLSEMGKRLAIKRARIAAGAVNKVSALVDLMKDRTEDKHMLIYCGATTLEGVETQNGIEDKRQIDLITQKLGLQLGMKVGKFTSEENMNERQMLKEDFVTGDLQALVAIKCLDEGVNIPMIKTAFILASTTNPKEYIQRRGRVLRLYEGKIYSTIYDFVILPRPLDMVDYVPKEQRQFDQALVKNELVRINEFRRLADNFYDSGQLVKEIMDAYNLYEEDVVWITEQ